MIASTTISRWRTDLCHEAFLAVELAYIFVVLVFIMVHHGAAIDVFMAVQRTLDSLDAFC
jgi:hypothetical protein